MKPVAEAAAGVVLASWVALGSSVSMFQQVIGPETAMSVGFVVNAAFIVAAALLIFRAGGTFRGWIDSVRDATNMAATLSALAERVEVLEQRQQDFERWRMQVDPILTELQIRTGVQRTQLGGEAS